MAEQDYPAGIDAAQLVIALERLKTVSADVAEMKSSMVQMASAVTRLAVMEERLGASREALERAFREITELQSRTKALESAQPAQAQTTKWVNQVIGLILAGVVGAGIASFTRPAREPANVPVIEQRK